MQVVTETAITEYPLVARGKVRDIYDLGRDQALIVTTDRMSAFDVVMNEPIPYKGVVLNQITLFWMEMFADLVPNHLLATRPEQFPAALAPHADQLEGRAVIVRRARPLPIECIVRGYITGSGWKDYQRTGMVCGEGAAQVVLESREHAERRGARPIARVAGTACRCEPSATSQQPTGAAIRRAMVAALEMAGLAPDAVGHVNAHGNSTRQDDPAEAQAIRQVLGDVPVTAPKSFFGNLGPGGGAVELAVSLVALAEGVVPPTLNYQTPDAACPVNVVTEPLSTDNHTLVALNHATTGPAVAVVLECEM